ncbi:hypothetical protein BPOR_0257g00080 [Botrytis porri]|uniref:Uncharacterized protein n=1 Tax=Botrytis porri TaxID=87229 RepID=A0A4Z1KLU5_9HELO|nr:hypothetical protein BPOR_0257g00080 [Botrytis porri]
MAPSGKGYPPPVPRVLRSKSGESLLPSQESQSQPSHPPNQASNTSSASSRNPSPTFPNLIPRSTPDLDPKLVSGAASQLQPHQDISRARSRVQSRSSSRARTGSSRPPPQNTSVPRPRDLLPRPEPGAIPHVVPRPRRTPMGRDLILGPGQGQFQIQLQAQPPPQIDPQTQERNQDFYTNYPYPFPTEDNPFSQSQMTNVLGDRRLHQDPHRDLHQPQPPPRIDSQTQDRNQDFYTNYPYPFPTEDSPFSQSQTITAPGNQNVRPDSHRAFHQPQFSPQVHSESRTQNQEIYTNFPSPFPDSHSPLSQSQTTTVPGYQDTLRDLVQTPAPAQAQNETQNRTSIRANKRPRLSYSDSYPNSRRDEDSNGDGDRDENRNRNGNETSSEIGIDNEAQTTTQNERYNPNDTPLESPLSTPPDSVSTSPPLLSLRNLPRRGTFTHSQRFNPSPTDRTRTRAAYQYQNENKNVTASRPRTTNPPSSSNPSNLYTEPPILPGTLDIAYRPTVAQKKWMYAVREEGKRSDSNENGGFSRGIEGQMVRLFGGEGEGGV